MASRSCWSKTVGAQRGNRVRVFERKPGSNLYIEVWERGRGKKRLSLGHKDRTEAQKQAHEVLVLRQNGEFSNGKQLTLGVLLERYWKESMGNIREADSFEELWFSEQAQKVRSMVRTCPKNCWMVGTAAPVMKKYVKHPAKWVIKNKIKSMIGRPICVQEVPYYPVGQDPQQGDLRMPDKAILDIPIQSDTA